MSGPFIDFSLLDCPKRLRTKRWSVSAKADGACLGVVGWYAPWRRYVYWPRHATLYEEHCLRAIAGFCEAETLKHKSGGVA